MDINALIATIIMGISEMPVAALMTLVVLASSTLAGLALWILAGCLKQKERQ